MKARFVYEALGDILKPKSQEDIDKDLLSYIKNISHKYPKVLTLTFDDATHHKNDLERSLKEYNVKLIKFKKPSWYKHISMEIPDNQVTIKGKFEDVCLWLMSNPYHIIEPDRLDRYLDYELSVVRKNPILNFIQNWPIPGDI